MHELFDEIVRTLATPLPRRRMLGRMAGLLAGAALTRLWPERAAAGTQGGRCPPGTRPSPDGTCVPVGQPGGGGGCPNPGEIRCAGTCVDAQTDPDNCGVCGSQCLEGEFCVAGQCTAIACAEYTTCTPEGPEDRVPCTPTNPNYPGQTCWVVLTTTGACVCIQSASTHDPDSEDNNQPFVCTTDAECTAKYGYPSVCIDGRAYTGDNPDSSSCNNIQNFCGHLCP